MDSQELENVTKKPANSPDSITSADPKENGSAYPAVGRSQLNSRLGLEEDSLVSNVLATHSNICSGDWITSEDLIEEDSPQFKMEAQKDVATCVRTAFQMTDKADFKRSTDDSIFAQPDSKVPRIDREGGAHGEGVGSKTQCWPLDRFCTMLLGDMWATRWETRHGAASGLRELLSESRHTKHCGKKTGMSKKEMEECHSRYLEDIAVRVLCTLALDQLSDFVSDEVIAPVRETAAQLLGVLSLHLSVEQLLLVVKHLMYLVALDLNFNTSQPGEVVSEHLSNDNSRSGLTWENTWMIVHGGLLGVKYLLASRKDAQDHLLSAVTPGLIAQLTPRTQSTDQSQANISMSAAEEDVRAAAASALVPIVGIDWLLSLGSSQVSKLLDQIWALLRDTTTDLSSSVGPLLRLIAAMNRSLSDLVHNLKLRKDPSHDNWSVIFESARLDAQFSVILRLLHHVSSGIRQHALQTLQCLLEVCFSQTISLPPSLVLLLIDQLYHRILLESHTAIRSLATRLCIDLVKCITLPILAQSCVERLDFWLCQAMQPVGVPFPQHLFSPNAASAAVSWCRSSIADGQLQTHQPHTKVNLEQQSLSMEQVPNEANLFYIGGSQSESDVHIWKTRMCTVRVLAVLFGRLCQYFPEDDCRSQSTVNPEDQPSILRYVLDNLFCRLHLKERLAMQRTITGLILSYWALLPSGDVETKEQSNTGHISWADLINEIDASFVLTSNPLHPILLDELRVLCVTLRERLVSCLTEVVYYEEILGLFKLMQEDCRQVSCAFSASGLPNDPLLSATGVRTIAQCSTMLDRALQVLQSSATSLAQPNEDELNDSNNAVHSLVQKARFTVDRCLSLQLLWGSRVEFSVAAAFVNLGWLLTGRLSLLIRPFMDMIRCAQPAHGEISEIPVTQSHPMGNDSGPHLQRMASACLAKLLFLEWSTTVQQGASTNICNQSKASSKVVKNLASLISDTNLQHTLCSNAEPNVGVLNDPNNHRRPSASDSETPVLDFNVVDSSPDALRAGQHRGAVLALSYLCHTFLEFPESRSSPKFPVDRPRKAKSLANLQRGLPGLWHLIWVDLIDHIWSIIKEVNNNITRCPATWKTFLPSILLNSVVVSGPAEDLVYTGLVALLSCVPVLLPYAESNNSFSFENLVHVGMLCCCLPSTKIRQAGTQLLIVLTVQGSVAFYNLFVSQFIQLFGTSGTGATERPCSAYSGILDALSAIVEALSSGSSVGESRIIDVFDPLVDPDSDLAPEDHTDDGGSTNQLALPVRLFLPYMSVMVPPVLRLLPNQNVTIRQSASRLFNALLNLFPFESSVPNPPEMEAAMCAERARCRRFIESLLHPECIEQYSLPVPVNAQLRSYQQDGVNWLNFLNRFGLNGVLCDDLGLGKTLQTICIVAGSHHEIFQAGRKEKSVSLVVCPSTLCGHWLCEVKQFVHVDVLSPIIYGGTPSIRQDLQANIHQYDLVIASYDMVRNDVHFFETVNWNYVVLDEGHIIKSSKSKISRAVKKLQSEHRLILTGTPIQNRVSELWSLFDFLMPDFLGPESAFNTRFAKPVAASRDPKASRADQRAGHLALKKLHRLVLPFMLRRLKEDVLADLPPKIIQDFCCEMTGIQIQLYQAFTSTNEGHRVCDFLNSMRGYEQTTSCPQATNRSRHGFEAFRYLQAVCNHPCLVLKAGHPALDDIRRAVQTEFGSNIPLDSVHLSGKLLGLCRLLTDCGFGEPTFKAGSSGSDPTTSFDSDRGLLSQHRVLLFFQTKSMLELTGNILRLHFPWITFTRLDGSVPVTERHSRVIRFNEDPSIDMMLLTTAVGGLGLNLTGADTVVFVEHDWNPTNDLQAMDRAHRIGQRRTVSVYRLITQDSIEQQIMNIQAFKLHLANTVITTENRDVRSMDTGHLFDRLAAFTPSGHDRSPSDYDSQYEAEYNLDAFVAKLAARMQ